MLGLVTIGPQRNLRDMPEARVRVGYSHCLPQLLTVGSLSHSQAELFCYKAPRPPLVLLECWRDPYATVTHQAKSPYFSAQLLHGSASHGLCD